MTKINLGDEVKDTFSKFRGIVTSVHLYLYGCTRMTVTTTDKEPKSMTFDLPQLKLIKKGKVQGGDKTIGGPNKYMDEGR